MGLVEIIIAAALMIGLGYKLLMLLRHHTASLPFVKILSLQKVVAEPVHVDASQQRELQELDHAFNQILFDQVAALLFEQQLHMRIRTQADQIQVYFLNKMPAAALSYIQDKELGEWSIYWSYQQQSLEYYVGRYGVFYVHIDRFNLEHMVQH
ncbi:hypothetical protein [Acinetobacter larvae]|uniref:Uncharacterized protein n=1 Tax=Acinetobacter larvae TaxID=1789224 RepID=A0A1B2LX00_9GAMM|nr:hypothetical protein [Acinetobacter larvae]AOA57419.1 hypothetical protein BFG52_02995 [Acinetobacter larvae]